MTLILNQRRTRQPQYPVGIDWGNPLTRGLAVAWTASNPIIELVTNTKASTNNALSQPARRGIASKCSLGQTNVEFASKDRITTSNGVGTGSFTLLAFCDPVNSGVVEHVFCQKNDAGGSPFAQATLVANSSAGGGATTGSFEFFCYNASIGSLQVSAFTPLDGKYHMFVGRRNGSEMTLWVDGLLVATTSVGGTMAITQSGVPRYLAIGSRGNGTTESYTQSVVTAQAWNRALSAAEIASISENPWQIFR